MTVMAVQKISVSLDERVLELAREAAEAEGKSLSAWLSDAAERATRIQAGLRAVAEFEAEHGAFTEDEIREADEALARMGLRRPR
jgi:hypothetical protein